ncbi:MAG: phosphodiester glycosidase family protein [Gracilibacteraceae bacterium]|jgi:exopolysaccharide biosynthesis protein|nr:phosphodiester glycosidase family protein [Gracilibacteraceae bacterium]
MGIRLKKVFRKRIVLFGVGYIALFLVLCPLMWLFGPFSYYRLFVTESIVFSSRSQIAYILMGQEKIDEVMALASLQEVVVEPVIREKSSSLADDDKGIVVESIEGRTFKGKVMIVENPARIRAAVTKDLGIAGQRLADIVDGQNAVAGINGGGFANPNSDESGALPGGVTIVDGEAACDTTGGEPMDLVGFTRDGMLALRSMTMDEALAYGYVQAVTFSPFLLVDGVPQIAGDGGWGQAPRTGIGQRADGAVILVVIDGRNAGWSMGATLRDLMNVFIEYNAVNAANLDGGSSTEMVYGRQTINRLWNILGSRYLASAFVVMPEQWQLSVDS